MDENMNKNMNKNMDKNMYKSFDELPLVLTPMDIKEIMNISKSNAYALCKSEGFPAKKVGKLIRINKESFKKWFEEQQPA